MEATQTPHLGQYPCPGLGGSGAGFLVLNINRSVVGLNIFDKSVNEQLFEVEPFFFFLKRRSW